MEKKYNIYKNFDDKALRKLPSLLSVKTMEYKPNQTISYSLGKRYMIGVMESGEASLVRFDYNGDKTIIEELESGDIFSDMFVSSDSSELSVISLTDSVVTFFSYQEIAAKAENSKYALNLLNNITLVMSKKLIKRNERIELLTKRSIRNKLLAYFELQAKKKNSKTFDLSYSYTDLADYLCVDRSALMRELKNLKEDKLIKDINKKITLLY